MLVPEGSFISGSDREERDYAYSIGSEAARRFRWYDRWELPRQVRREPAFRILRYHVTQEEYARFVAATGHRRPGTSRTEYTEQGFLVHPYSSVLPYLWDPSSSPHNAYPHERRNHPVVLVSQDDAIAYCRWLGDRRGSTGLLPTEWQWEKAARGGDGRYFPWGMRFDPRYLNAGYRFGGTTAVDRFPGGASPYGVMDMAGNVFEWTRSRFNKGKVTLKGGGSWDDSPGITRAASRHGRPPASRHILFGFRCVAEDTR